MPPEVINLLSSSPTASTPPFAASAAATLRTTRAIPSKVLSNDITDLTTKTSTNTSTKSSRGKSDQIPKEPVAGTKRNVGRSRYDNDFLFLSDDFDTTGDLDGNTTKKARLSSSSTNEGGKDNSSFTRTKSTIPASVGHSRRSPSALKRWNTVIDPIEHSSSPIGFPTSKHLNKQSANTRDPFDSPPKKQVTRSKPLDFSSDPFGSSPVRNATGNRLPPYSTKTRQPLESSTNKQPSKTPVFIDLSDDEPGCIAEKSVPEKVKSKAVAWDPISSSMPETRTTKDLGNSDSDSDLPDLSEINFSKIKSRRRAFSLSSSPPPKQSKVTRGPTAKKTTAAPKKTEEEKEQEKRKKAEAREVEKERKRVEKERAKEQRADEKKREKALAEVNKVRTNKKVAAPEMIVDLPTTLGIGIKTQIEKLLSDLSIQFEYHDSPIDNVIRWRRHVDSIYDKEDGQYQPVPTHIQKEDHVLIIIGAADFIKLVLGDEGQDIEAHVLTLKTCFPGNTLVFLMEGLIPWMRKNRSILNRQFASAVRAQDASNNPGSTSGQASRRRKNVQQEYVDENTIEDALLSLQVLHGALIHHTNVQVETAEWVAAFTEHLGTVPYRKMSDEVTKANFCMDAGQVKTGEDAKETYILMLQEVNRVTAPIAHGIAARYSNVGELVRGLERDGPLALENCRKSANGDGAFTDRVVGPAISRRMYKIFTSRDPGSMDV